jgi:two-component system, cell cycle sensor histidine kinase and response regulator CckA
VRPKRPITIDSIEHCTGRPIVLSVSGTELLLSGAFYHLSGHYLFLGSPKVDSVNDLAPLELRIDDFAPQDLVITHLLQLQKMEVSATESVEAANRLTEQQLIYRSIVEQSHDIIVAVDKHGRVSHANPRARATLGEEIVGKRGSRLLTLDSRKIWKRAAANLVGDAGSHWVELDLADYTGTSLQVEGHLVLNLEVGHGEVITAILRDVTQRKQTEAELRISNEKLQQARQMEALGRFAGGIAHDFNNLLGVISGAAELLQGDMEPEDSRQSDIEMILSTVTKGAELSRQVFQFSQQQTPTKGQSDLATHTRSMKPILQRTVGASIDLSISILTDPALVEIPPVQYEQMLMNLVVNAAHAMPDGGRLLIEIGRDEIRNEVFFKVEDSGEGIKPDVLRRIFEPFYSTRSPGLGSGLGLSVVYGIVKGAGGEVHVESQEGTGTTFRITLPASTSDPVSKESTGAAAAWQQVAQIGARVVLLEDQPDLRNLIIRALQKMGVQALAFSSLADAREGFRAYQGVPNLFITDVTLTDGNGLDLAEELADQGKLNKVIIITGNADFDRVGSLTSEHGWELLIKPFQLRELNELVVKAIGQ